MNEAHSAGGAEARSGRVRRYDYLNRPVAAPGHPDYMTDDDSAAAGDPAPAKRAGTERETPQARPSGNDARASTRGKGRGGYGLTGADGVGAASDGDGRDARSYGLEGAPLLALPEPRDVAPDGLAGDIAAITTETTETTETGAAPQPTPAVEPRHDGQPAEQPATLHPEESGPAERVAGDARHEAVDEGVGEGVEEDVDPLVSAPAAPAAPAATAEGVPYEPPPAAPSDDGDRPSLHGSMAAVPATEAAVAPAERVQLPAQPQRAGAGPAERAAVAGVAAAVAAGVLSMLRRPRSGD